MSSIRQQRSININRVTSNVEEE